VIWGRWCQHLHLQWCDDVVIIPTISFVVVGGSGVNGRTGLAATLV
jgi:hypothetical protein